VNMWLAHQINIVSNGMRLCFRVCNSPLTYLCTLDRSESLHARLFSRLVSFRYENIFFRFLSSTSPLMRLSSFVRGLHWAKVSLNTSSNDANGMVMHESDWVSWTSREVSCECLTSSLTQLLKSIKKGL